MSLWDSSTTPPTFLAPEPDRVGQHGLEIVMALCRSFSLHPEPVGKRITAAVTLTDAPDTGADGRPL
ncbi:hypothetical protein ABZ471_47855 [Streptomyces sp. NPDC005728]|uniref:hypothetical protein n=1 Tax=Streptomyces sp. NPDC005728 TaxID=3157054 RepID=UPI0033EC7DA5